MALQIIKTLKNIFVSFLTIILILCYDLFFFFICHFQLAVRRIAFKKVIIDTHTVTCGDVHIFNEKNHK